MTVTVIHRPDQDTGPAPQLELSDQVFEPSKELAAHIDATWARKTEEAQAKGRDWYNGKILSPIETTAEGVAVRAAHFADFVGTRHLPADVKVRDRVSPVSVAILPVEVDEPGGTIKRLRFFRRNGNSLDFAGYFSGLGGLMEPDVDGLDPVKTAVREVREESGLVVSPQQLTYLGTATVAPEHSLTFCYLLELTSAQIAGGFVFEDKEMTHSLRVPTWVLRVLKLPLAPIAPWVQAFARLTLDQHGDRM